MRKILKYLWWHFLIYINVYDTVYYDSITKSSFAYIIPLHIVSMTITALVMNSQLLDRSLTRIFSQRQNALRIAMPTTQKHCLHQRCLKYTAQCRLQVLIAVGWPIHQNYWHPFNLGMMRKRRTRWTNFSLITVDWQNSKYRYDTCRCNVRNILRCGIFPPRPFYPQYHITEILVRYWTSGNWPWCWGDLLRYCTAGYWLLVVMYGGSSQLFIPSATVAISWWASS